jgi:hypothetical protein
MSGIDGGSDLKNPSFLSPGKIIPKPTDASISTIMKPILPPTAYIPESPQKRIDTLRPRLKNVLEFEDE